MLSIEKLQELGANTSEGLRRCLNNEAFYLNLVKMGLCDQSFENLENAIKNNDLNKGFEYAHALKGALGNLALTPLYTVVCEITEELRARKEIDYTPLLTKINEIKEKFTSLI